jgi:predicted PurR-regulated permease PerM
VTYREFVKRFLTVVAVILGLLGIWQLREIVLVVFLAAIIAISLSVPVHRLQAWGLKRGYAIAITLTVVLLGFVTFLVWLLPVLVTQMADLVEELPDAVDQTVLEYNDWRGKQSSTVQDILPEANYEEIEKQLGLGESDEPPAFDFSDVSNVALPVLGGAANFALGLVAQLAVIIIVSIFFLLDPSDYVRGIITLFPESYRPRTLEVIAQLQKTVVTWMAALSLSISVTVVLVTVILGWVLRVPNSLALGVIAGVTTVIPNIGSLISIVPIIIFTLADDPAKLPFVLIAYLLIQQVESNVITPSIVKRELSIPPAALLIFQLVAAALFGFFGILLAVPMLATLMTLVRELYLYDVLGMRGSKVEIEQLEDGSWKVYQVDAEPTDKPHQETATIG